MTTTPTAVLHGITILDVADRDTLRASCLCGRRSELLTSRRDAVAAGNQHTAEITYDLPVPYVPTDRRHNGLTFNDEGVTVHRLSWRSDRQWLFIRERMIAHFEAEGMTRDEVAR